MKHTRRSFLYSLPLLVAGMMACPVIAAPPAIGSRCRKERWLDQMPPICGRDHVGTTDRGWMYVSYKLTSETRVERELRGSFEIIKRIPTGRWLEVKEWLYVGDKSLNEAIQ